MQNTHESAALKIKEEPWIAKNEFYIEGISGLFLCKSFKVNLFGLPLGLSGVKKEVIRAHLCIKLLKQTVLTLKIKNDEND